MTWPSPDKVVTTAKGYVTPDGPFPRVTTILKVLGLGSEALIRWAADLERTAVLEAAEHVYAHGSHGGPEEFRAAVESQVGKERQHQRKLTKAADIGSSIHAMIQWTLKGELGENPGPKPFMPDEATWAFMAWKSWWAGSGLKPYRIEQPVWDRELGYAGTVDLIAHGPNGLEVWDWKSGKGIYESYHLQTTAYIHACCNWEPVTGGGIVRVPKVIGDPDVEVKRIGDMTYDYRDRSGKRVQGGRVVEHAELLEAFRSTKRLYDLFLKGREA
mgnify:CR=1 FL=1